MSEMFCFQCQQTAGNKGCVKTGVCGKQPETAALQDDLVKELIRLTIAADEKGAFHGRDGHCVTPLDASFRNERNGGIRSPRDEPRV